MSNPYEPWIAANACLMEINETLKHLYDAMSALDIPPFSKIIIQSHLLKIQETTNKYIATVKPIMEELKEKR